MPADVEKQVVLLLRFSPPAAKWLRGESKRLGISVAEFVRRIIDEKRGASPRKEGP